MNRRLACNRPNLLRLRREVVHTQAGLRLLQSKREALMKAFLASVEERVHYLDRLEEKSRHAAHSLPLAYARLGSHGVTSHGWAAQRTFPLEVVRDVVWGTAVARFRTRPLRRDFRQRGFDAASSDASVHEAADRFEDLLTTVLEAAAIDVRLRRLGAEIQKTTRRINALEERLLPDLQQRAKRIRERLDEFERDETHRLRSLKRRPTGSY